MSQTIEEFFNSANSLPPAVKFLLADRLLASLKTPLEEDNSVDAGLTLTLNSELEQKLLRESAEMGITPEQYAAQTIEKHLNQLERKRREEKLTALRAWNEQYDEEEQKDTWEYLVRVLDEDRPADRKLFPEDLKGVSW